MNTIGYDAGKITIKLKSNLIKYYFSNLYGMFMSMPDVNTEDIEITRESDSTAIIRITVENSDSEEQEQPSLFPSGYSPAIMKIIEKYKTVLNEFYYSAIRKEHRTTEILPLNGYDAEDLKSDVMRAVQEKKKFCIIREYSEFLDQNNANTPNPKYHQVVLECGTKEYIDAAILFLEKDLKTLNKIYKDKLVLESWT